MSTKKRIARWSFAILTVLLYLAIAAIPFTNRLYNPNQELTGVLKLLTVGEMIVLGIMLVVLIAVVVICLKKREKVGSLVREYEGEVKRITWLSWSETKKSTVLVLLALVAFAVVIALIDLALSEGFLGLVDGVKQLVAKSASK
jgi:preprotein translocase SecE subunit